MTVVESDCEGSATTITSESVILSFSSKTGPLDSTTGALLDIIPVVGYRGSS